VKPDNQGKKHGESRNTRRYVAPGFSRLGGTGLEKQGFEAGSRELTVKDELEHGEADLRTGGSAAHDIGGERTGAAIYNLALNACLMATAHGVRCLGPDNPSYHEWLKRYPKLSRKWGHDRAAALGDPVVLFTDFSTVETGQAKVGQAFDEAADERAYEGLRCLQPPAA
jgi:hypothetical protein